MRKTLFITRLVVLLAITLAIGLIGLPQPITGPFINFMLILTTMMISAPAGLIMGCITPLLALLRGQLPAPLAAMVPFIILANLLFVLCFALLKTGNVLTAAHYYLRNGLAIFAAAALKFVVLFASARFIFPLLLGKTIPEKLISILTLPQLITALLGGGFALFFFRLWQRKFPSR
jgi:hypothetical protein